MKSPERKNIYRDQSPRGEFSALLYLANTVQSTIGDHTITRKKDVHKP